MALFPLQIAYSLRIAASHKAQDFLALKPSRWEHRQNRTIYFKLLKHAFYLR